MKPYEGDMKDTEHQMHNADRKRFPLQSEARLSMMLQDISSMTANVAAHFLFLIRNKRQYNAAFPSGK